MPEWLTAAVLRVLRVPPEPEPPPGDPATLRVFRAAPAYFRYRLLTWGMAQAGALLGLVIGSFVFGGFVGALPGRWTAPAVAMGGILAWIVYLVQLPVSLAALGVDYELRWYMLSDRALRIREGAITVREKTVTFANIQQISVRQGPVQRLLGLADIEVRSAGGGGSSSGSEGATDLHRGYLRGVQDAERIRDTMRARVQRDREEGGPAAVLADPGGEPPAGSSPLDAAAELLTEVRALRHVFEPGPAGAAAHRLSRPPSAGD